MEQHEDRPTVDIAVDPDDLEASTPDALIGATLHDTYKVVRVLAEGGMGRVYEATHTRISTKRFAIKVLLAELKHSLDVRLRFRREAEAAASVEHPNVVGVHDFGYAPDGRPYLVCDLLEGRELGDMLQTRVPLSVPLSAAIARQLCAALATAHDKGVIHRDIKPANIFLIGPDDAPQVKILDFGLSKIVELTEAGVTQTGVVMGTPSYMAPEQARGERADHRVDIYGVGAVLYACLTGRPPHEEESAQQTILAVMTREAPRPCSLVPGIPPGLEIVVQRAMANQPLDRYASMRDLDAALAPWVSDSGPMSSRTSSPAPPSAVRLAAASLASMPDTAEAEGIRNRAAGWLFLAVLLSLLTATSAALGVLAILAPGRQVLQSELLLVVLAVIGSLFTPGILVGRFIKRKYWNNSARMVDLVVAVRAPVLAAAFAYGTASLLFRVLDASSAQLAMPIGAPHGSGWLGWAPFFAAVGLAAALAATFRQRLLAGSSTFMRRFLGGPVIVSLALVGSAAALYFGVDVGTRARAARQAAVRDSDDILPEPSTSASATASGPVKPGHSAPSGVVEPPPAPLSPADRAPPGELARVENTADLGALQARYPRDPAVLEAYALALGKDPQRASEMLRVLDALFAAAPERVSDEALGKLLLPAALTPSTSQRAIDVMAGRMGVRGAEMLFDLVLSQPEIRPRARAALDTPAVQRVLTPSLKVSFDIYTAATCEARVKLLPQAVRDGDERTIGALTIFTLSMKRACGYKNRQQCVAPPLCAANVVDFNNAKAAIKARLASLPKKD